ncbi:MAG: hypothetical protein CMJ18_11710, partial [Phycisphaeraceae bacterium]|nr:hypothetical protein [Phycisphaeraceae bacterium]
GVVGTFEVGDDLAGDVTIRGTNAKKTALNKFILGGDLVEGSLLVEGSVGTIDVAGGLGAAGENLTVRGDLNKINVGTSKTTAGSDLGLDLLVQGDVGTFIATGSVTGDVIIEGDAKNIMVTADAATTGTDILAGDVKIFGEAKRISISGGHVAAGTEIVAGSDIVKFDLTSGSVKPGALVASSFGDVRNLSIKGGDLLGSVRAGNGSIDKITVTAGSDFGNGDDPAEIRARSGGTFKFSGSVRDGAVIEIDDVLKSLSVDGGIEANTKNLDGGGDPRPSVAAGEAPTLKIGGDVTGDLDLGPAARGSRLTIGGDLGGRSVIDANTRLTVGGDVLAGSRQVFTGNLDQLGVTGTIFGDVIVDGTGGRWTAGAVDGAVITSGLDLTQFTISGGVSNSLIQAGIQSGLDHEFAATPSAADFGEHAGMGGIGRFSATAISDSVVAAGGPFDRLSASASIIDSSVSSGFNLGSTAIRAVQDDLTPLFDDVERNAARSGTDRRLFNGDFSSITAGSTIIDSSLTAGVDPGDDGAFGTGIGVNADRVFIPDTGNVLPDGGGDSRFGSVAATIDAASYVLSDGGISSNRISGSPIVNTDVSYAISDLTDDLGSPLEPFAASVPTGGSLFFEGLTIALSGSPVGATIDIHDTPGDPDTIDTLVVSGTDGRAALTITGGKTIGRILTDDDAKLGHFSYDGAIGGDGVAASPDLWFDATASDYGFGTFADGVTGVIGGDVSKLTIEEMGELALRIAGQIKNLEIVEGTGTNGLISDLAATPTDDVSLIAIDDTGATWVYDPVLNELSQVDTATGLVLTGPFSVTDAQTGEDLVLDAIDFDNPLLGVAELFNPTPSQTLGSLVDTDSAPADLRGLAASAFGRIVAVETAGVDTDGDDEFDFFRDVVVDIDMTSGRISPIGDVRDIFNNEFRSGNPGDAVGEAIVRTITYSPFGVLVAIVSDRDGEGPDGAGAALAALDTTTSVGDGIVNLTSPLSPFLPAVPLDDGGPITDDFTAMAIDEFGTIHAIRRVGAEDVLVLIDVSGAVFTVGAVKIGGADTDIGGMGFNADGMLTAYDTAGGTGQIITVSTTAPGTDSAIIGEAGLLDPFVDAFTTRSTSFLVDPDANAPTYAYDTGDNFDDGGLPMRDGDTDDPGDVPGGAFFTSGADTSRTLGVIDPTDGTFTRRAVLTVDDDGAPLTGAVAGMSVDNSAGGSGELFVATEDDRLFRYDTATGLLIKAAGTFTNPATGRVVDIADIEHNDDDLILMGLDEGLNRLVSIDPDDATIAPTLEPGAVAEGVNRITFDTSVAPAVLVGIDVDNDRFVSFNGFTQSALSNVGLSADSISTMSITGPGTFTSRVTTEGNSFGRVSITGDFAGNLVTGAAISQFDLAGALAGSILARSIDRMKIAGEISASGIVRATSTISRLDQAGGDVAGRVLTESAGTLKFDAAALPGSDLLVNLDAGTISYTGDQDGLVELGRVDRRLTIGGTLGPAADVLIHGDAAGVNLDDGTEAGSRVLVDGRARSINVDGNHSGLIATRFGADQATFNDVDLGLFAAGLESGRLTVNGDTEGGVYSFGAWVGPDGVYNTPDDLLTGGSLDSATFKGVFNDGVLAIAVLPSVEAGSSNPNNLPDDNRAYSGNAAADDVREADSAQAGGLFTGTVGRLTMQGQITNTAAADGRLPVVVAAGGVDRASLGAFGFALTPRTLDDPTGPVQVESSTILGDTQIEILFSESVDTSTFTLAFDGNDDGDVDDVVDVPGSIEIRDADDSIIDDGGTILSYDNRLADDGRTQGVLTLRRPEGFGDRVKITLFGRTLNLAGDPITAADLEMSPTIHDRSGLRSVLRDFNQDGIVETGEDFLGSILDVDGDGLEGGQSGDDSVTLEFILTDAPDDFVEALASEPLDLTVDSGPLALTSRLENVTDVDVYRIMADAYQFLSVTTEAEFPILTGVFVLDDQGTPLDPSDDRFEMLTRWEDNGLEESPNFEFDPDLLPEQIMSFELPPVEDAGAPGGFDTTDLEYFVLVGKPGLANSLEVGTYVVTVNLASTDLGLGDLPPEEPIAYISNTIGENNNLAGAQEPKQLVYLNFDGGIVREIDLHEGDAVEPFDPGVINPLLADKRELMIFGGTGEDGDPVVGIVELILEGYRDTPASHPLGQLNVQLLGGDLTAFETATDGLFFTLTDPRLSGLDPATDFTILYIGQLDTIPDLYGVASHVDFANLDKADEAITFVQNFVGATFGISDPGDPDALTREFSEGIAGTTVHELAHVLGLNHTLRDTEVDDPNNDGDPSDTVLPDQLNIIAGGPGSIFPDDFLINPVIGTSGVDTDEFPSVGGLFDQQAFIDSLSNLLFWLK